MEILTVQEQKNGYVVNGSVFVPDNSQNSDFQAIQKWVVAGGIVGKENLLAQTKAAKLSEIKSLRDQKNIEPITGFKAFVLDETGNKTEQESHFLFYTNRHQTNPNSDPEAIISRVFALGAMPYFTKDTSGNKITIELTTEISASLRRSIAQRNDDNYKISSSIEALIEDAKTPEEVEVIAWEAST
jgi:hypothetical protein